MPAKKERWTLISIHKESHKVHVMDNLSKRTRFYGVPDLVSAVINDHALDISTDRGKVMRINLHNGSRQFIIE